MSETPSANPYQAPRAELRVDAVLGGFAGALQGFAKTKPVIRTYAAILMGVAVCTGMLSLIATQMTAALGTPSWTAWLLAAACLANGATHWKLASRIREAERQPDLAHVTAIIAALRQSWFTSAISYIATSLIPSATQLLGITSASAFAVASPPPATIEHEAERLRRALRIMLGVLALSGVAMIATEAGPTNDGPYQLGVIAGIFSFFASYGALVWKQLEPLAAFITAPSPETLGPLARAHRILWMVIGVAMLLLMAGAVVAGVLVLALSPSELPAQR